MKAGEKRLIGLFLSKLYMQDAKHTTWVDDQYNLKVGGKGEISKKSKREYTGTKFKF